MTNAIRFLALILFFALTSQAFAQQNKVDATLHSRVDTTNSEIKKVAELWLNYLSASPDSLYDNPYWNQAEKEAFKIADLSIPYLYQIPSDQLLSYYKPTILSVEKEGEYYGIRTIFSADAVPAAYRKSNPWSITKLYAVKENGAWKLKNALLVITANWNRTRVGKITFIYPAEHQFDAELATKASQFCDNIAAKFGFPEWKPFDFYITKSGDELGELLNFDFFFAGFTTGVAIHENRILFSGLGSEYYPHEFIHLILPHQERHALIEEGFATWKGGQGGKTFEQSAKLLADELAKNESVTFADVLSKKWGWQYAAFYTSGAILCHSAFERGGAELVNELLKLPNDGESLVENLCALFEIEKSEFDDYWRKEVLKFSIR